METLEMIGIVNDNAMATASGDHEREIKYTVLEHLV